VLPSPISARHALRVLLIGFAVEGGTELYQFLERGNLVQGPVVYYTTLATTIVGFYLMFLGLREWHTFHPKPAVQPEGSSARRLPWVGLALWTGGTVMTAVLSLTLGAQGTGTAPAWIAWPVGGLVVLALGKFFFDLRKESSRLGLVGGRVVGWAAFTWSLGVATVAGVVVGSRAVLLLTEFVSNWVALVASLGPIVVAMSLLFVTYALMIVAFWPAVRGPIELVATDATGTRSLSGCVPSSPESRGHS
jgi:hypothetical protein